MKLSDIMGEAGFVSWAEAGLIVSFLTFAAIVAYVFLLRSRSSFEEARQLPLDDDGACQVRSSAVAGPSVDSESSADPSNCETAELARSEVSS